MLSKKIKLVLGTIGATGILLSGCGVDKNSASGQLSESALKSDESVVGTVKFKDSEIDKIKQYSGDYKDRFLIVYLGELTYDMYKSKEDIPGYIDKLSRQAGTKDEPGGLTNLDSDTYKNYYDQVSQAYSSNLFTQDVLNISDETIEKKFKNNQQSYSIAGILYDEDLKGKKKAKIDKYIKELNKVTSEGDWSKLQAKIGSNDDWSSLSVIENEYTLKEDTFYKQLINKPTGEVLKLEEGNGIIGAYKILSKSPDNIDSFKSVYLEGEIAKREDLSDSLSTIFKELSNQEEDEKKIPFKLSKKAISTIAEEEEKIGEIMAKETAESESSDNEELSDEEYDKASEELEEKLNEGTTK